MDPATRSPRPLPRRVASAPDHRGADLIEGQFEHVVKNERETLGGSQRVHHHMKGEAARVGQERLLSPAKLQPPESRWDQVPRPRATPRREHPPARSMLRHTRATIVGAALRFSTSSAPAPPTRYLPVLTWVLRVRNRAQHPVCHRPQVGADAPRNARPATACHPRSRPPITGILQEMTPPRLKT